MGHRNKTREVDDFLTSQSELRVLNVLANDWILIPDQKKLSKMSEVGVSNDISSTIIAVFTCGVAMTAEAQ